MSQSHNLRLIFQKFNFQNPKNWVYSKMKIKGTKKMCSTLQIEINSLIERLINLIWKPRFFPTSEAQWKMRFLAMVATLPLTYPPTLDRYHHIEVDLPTYPKIWHHMWMAPYRLLPRQSGLDSTSYNVFFGWGAWQKIIASLNVYWINL